MEIISLKEPGLNEANVFRDATSLQHRITDLKPSLKDQNRVNVFIDDKFDFSLDIAQVVDLGVKVGLDVSESRLEELRTASEFGKLYQRTLEWALARPHSRKEVQDYLKQRSIRRRAENQLRAANAKKSAEEKQKYHLKTKILPEISDENIKLVMARLTERGYIDDEKFAKYYLENRFAKKGISRRRLELELAQKGIDENIVAKVFAENPRNEADEIRKIINKKSGRYSEEKLIQYLTRQGFDYQLSRSLVHEMDSQSSE